MVLRVPGICFRILVCVVRHIDMEILSYRNKFCTHSAPWKQEASVGQGAQRKDKAGSVRRQRGGVMVKCRQEPLLWSHRKDQIRHGR